MKRLLQLSTALLVLVSVITPVIECFDSWDPAGLLNDTEFPLFLIVLSLSLVLLVVRLIARIPQSIRTATEGEAPPRSRLSGGIDAVTLEFFSPASPRTPLRI